MKTKFTGWVLFIGIFVLTSVAQAGDKKSVILNFQGEGDVDFNDCLCRDPMIEVTCDKKFNVRSLYAVTDIRTKFFSAYADNIQGMPRFYGHDDEPEYKVGWGEAWTQYDEGMGKGAELVSGLGINNNLTLSEGAKLIFLGKSDAEDFPDSVHIWGSAMIEAEEGTSCEILFDDWILYQ